MAIFSRRVVQRALDENSFFLSAAQKDNHVNKLNNLNDFNSAIATEWEVIILNALSKVGDIKHEQTFKGTTNPDIYFTAKGINFLAEVTVMSDEAYDDDNPINYFNEQLNGLFRKEGIIPHGISVTFGSEHASSKIKIKLPQKNDIPKLIKKELSEFIISIKNNPILPISKKIDKNNVFITIEFDPKKPFYTISHQSYNIPQSLERNPLFNKLKKKNSQLKNTEYDGVAGVFICDGDCDFLNKQSFNNQKYSQENIVKEFFKKNTTLSFVLIITPEEDFDVYSQKTKYIKTKLHINPDAKFPVSQELSVLLEQFIKNIPTHESMPINAKNNIKSDSHCGLSFYGGFSLSGDNVIKIPSRMLTGLLSGNLNFDQLYGNDTSRNSSRNMLNNFFIRQQNEGAMIESITVEKCIDRDDDWLIIKYSSTSDAAISKYK